jgi:hypothetical protein
MKTTNIASQIEELLTQRKRHEDALAAINRTLDNIAGMIGANGTQVAVRAAAPAAKSAAPAASPRTRRRRNFGMTAEDFVLGFVKQHRNPITRDVNAAWTQAGRPFKADITLSKLTREGKLKRTPLVGERGSRYTVA